MTENVASGRAPDRDRVLVLVGFL